MSKTIESNKKDYYDALQMAQQDSIDITTWITYFVKTVLAAQTEAEEQIDFTLNKVKFFDQYKDRLSQRQLKVIKRMTLVGTSGGRSTRYEINF